MSTFPKMHISLYVNDIKETREFYTNFFGERPSKEKSEYLRYTLDAPSLVISFIENKERVQPSFGHLGFQVESESIVAQKLKQAKANGFDIKEEIGTACCYGLQDKFWVKDPNGYNWEVYYFHKDVEFNDPHYEQNSAEVCCMPDAKPKIKLAELIATKETEEKNACDPQSGCC